MNRRAFCLSLAAAAACSAGEKRHRRRPRADDAHAEPGGPVIVDKATPYIHRRQRSVLEFFGDTLAQRTRDGIAVWDMLAMRRLAEHPIHPRSFCFTRTGMVAAFDVIEDRCVVHLIGRNGTRTLQGPQFAGPGVIFPAADTGFYVLGMQAVVVLEEVNGRVEQAALLELPDGSKTRPHLVYSLGDGRLVIADGLHILARGAPPQSYGQKRRPMHAAPMPGDRCWLSYEGADERVDALALVAITDPAAPAAQVAFPREHVLHLASSPAGDLAVLLYSLDAAPTYVERWAVVVLDPSGRERWRVEVPRSHAGPQLTTTGFVAISEQRVVLRGPRDALLAWDATSGKLVG